MPNAAPAGAPSILPMRIALPRLTQLPPNESKTPSAIYRWVTGWAQNLLRAIQQDVDHVHRVVNSITDQGPGITAAATIQVTQRTHIVSGTAAISTISAEPGFRGILYLIAGGAWSLVTGGNIALALAPTVGSLVPLVYDVATALWYPVVVQSGGTTIPYVPRGTVILAGLKNSANQTFTLPGADTFWLDTNGYIYGQVWWKGNRLFENLVGPPGPFEFQRFGASSIVVGIPPDAGDELDILNLFVNA